MTRFTVALALGAVLFSANAQASWLFPKGVGNHGPYTGGHGYSYATAYHYGFAWSAADTWRIDPFAYRFGYSPYRPNGKPISARVFPHPDTPYFSVPGPDGLPTLMKPPCQGEETVPLVPGMMVPTPAPLLNPVPATLPQPVPASVSTTSGTIKLQVPPTAEVWVEKQRVEQGGAERVYQTPPLMPGKMEVLSIRARWVEGGREVERFRVVGLRAGETAKVTFSTAVP